MDRIFVIHLYVRYVINVLLLMSFAKHKKNPHFVLGTNRGGLVIEWSRLLNSQNFRRNSIVRIDHCILFNYSNRVQFAGLPIKIFLLQK